MRIEYTKSYFLDKEDFRFIRKQMKDKGISVKELYEEMQISRSYFYDMANGRRNAEQLIVALGYHLIYPTYNIARDGR